MNPSLSDTSPPHGFSREGYVCPYWREKGHKTSLAPTLTSSLHICRNWDSRDEF